MSVMIKKLVKDGVRRLGYDVHRIGSKSSDPLVISQEFLPPSASPIPVPAAPPAAQPTFHDILDVEQWVQDIAKKVEPYTMTSRARVAGLCSAIEYVTRRKIPGDFVECGVWRGGSSMAAAWALSHVGDLSRSLHLFDTFEGMPPPTELDRRHDGMAADEILAGEAEDSGYWARASLDDVQHNLAMTNYPAAKINYIKGKVEDTIPSSLVGQIAVLRLDTDWYESTKHELEHLFPLLVEGGVLIIDDYGFWRGARRAVDDYFEQHRSILLARVDETGRMGIKA